MISWDDVMKVVPKLMLKVYGAVTIDSCTKLLSCTDIPIIEYAVCIAIYNDATVLKNTPNKNPCTLHTCKIIFDYCQKRTLFSLFQHQF